MRGLNRKSSPGWDSHFLYPSQSERLQDRRQPGAAGDRSDQHNGLLRVSVPRHRQFWEVCVTLYASLTTVSMKVQPAPSTPAGPRWTLRPGFALQREGSSQVSVFQSLSPSCGFLRHYSFVFSSLIREENLSIGLLNPPNPFGNHRVLEPAEDGVHDLVTYIRDFSYLKLCLCLKLLDPRVSLLWPKERIVWFVAAQILPFYECSLFSTLQSVLHVVSHFPFLLQVWSSCSPWRSSCQRSITSPRLLWLQSSSAPWHPCWITAPWQRCGACTVGGHGFGPWSSWMNDSLVNWSVDPFSGALDKILQAVPPIFCLETSLYLWQF